MEFYADGTEYEYWIKANDDTVVKKEQELSDKQQAQTTTAGETVSLDEAKQIVLEDAGVSEADVTFTKTKEEKDTAARFMIWNSTRQIRNSNMNSTPQAEAFSIRIRKRARRLPSPIRPRRLKQNRNKTSKHNRKQWSDQLG